MAWTFIASAAGEETTSDATIACSAALTVASGDLIVGLAKWEGTDPGDAVIAGATNTLTMATAVQYSTQVGIRFGYKIAASADAAETFALTLTARGYKGVVVMQFRPDSGETVTLDAGGNGAAGTGTAAQSGNISTSAAATDAILIGGVGSYLTQAMSGEQIADTNATGIEDGASSAYLAIWYLLATEQQTDIHAQCTTPNGGWACDVMAFKSVASGGGSSIVAIAQQEARRRRV